MKTCTKCKTKKSIKSFYIKKYPYRISEKIHGYGKFRISYVVASICKSCNNLKSKEYAKNNSSKVNEYKKQYRIKNRVKINERNKNKDREIAIQKKGDKQALIKKIIEDNFEKIHFMVLLHKIYKIKARRGRYNKWLKNNHEKAREYRRKWKKENPTQQVIDSNKRSALKVGAEGSFSVKEWEELKRENNFMCLSCKKYEPKIKLTVDHIVPLSKNGSNYIENIQPLCGVCNSKKATKIIAYLKR